MIRFCAIDFICLLDSRDLDCYDLPLANLAMTGFFKILRFAESKRKILHKSQNLP
ncbi:hypothetical protein [Helicobacter sp. 23-1045]